MKVYAKHNSIVESFNARNKKGNKLRKSRGIKEGEAFEVKRKFTIIGDASDGPEHFLELFGPNEETYQVPAKDFNVEERKQEPRIEHEENELERLTRCIREIVEDPENKEFTSKFRKSDHPEVKRIYLERSVGNKKVFVQGFLDSKYIYSHTVGVVNKEHAVIYFQDFAGNMYKKWIYPSKNKSDEIIKRKIRSIMREWIIKLVEKEEKIQKEDQDIEKKRKQLMEDLKEFHPGLPVNESSKSIIIPYRKSSGVKSNISVSFDEDGNYKTRLGLGELPVFTKDGLGIFLQALTKAI